MTEPSLIAKLPGISTITPEGWMFFDKREDAR